MLKLEFQKNIVQIIYGNFKFLMYMNNNGKMNFLMGNDAISMGNNSLTEEAKLSAMRAFNEATDKATKSFNANIDKELEKSKQVKEEAKNLEIIPTNGYVLIRIYAKNPYEQVKVTESGLIIPTYNGEFQSKKSGETEVEDLAVKYGEVIEVGPDVKYIQAGDDIIFRNHTQLPAPFLGQDLWIVGQNNVIVIINENLKERINNGR